jgi:two-component sensor histidine kinase
MQSVPWDEVDLEAAGALRVALLENVLKRMDLAKREREAAIRRQDLLMAELDHRVKNTLANIQALVLHTRAGAATLESFATALEWRIRAMAHAHTLLAESRWEGASVRSLVEEELAAYHDGSSKAYSLTGPDILLMPKAALSLALVLHELTTNAAKYGALSVPDGWVEVDWSLDPAAMLFTLHWKECGGPPVLPPRSKGFGSVVIERSLTYEFEGTTALSFDPKGVTCTLTLPAACTIRRDPEMEATGLPS